MEELSPEEIEEMKNKLALVLTAGAMALQAQAADQITVQEEPHAMVSVHQLTCGTIDGMPNLAATEPMVFSFLINPAYLMGEVSILSQHARPTIRPRQMIAEGCNKELLLRVIESSHMHFEFAEASVKLTTRINKELKYKAEDLELTLHDPENIENKVVFTSSEVVSL